MMIKVSRLIVCALVVLFGAQIADMSVVNAGEPQRYLGVRYREYTIPAGTRITVRLANTVSSETSRVEDPVSATLTAPVVVDGARVLPAGSVLRGDVASVQRSGRVKGRASLGLRFNTLTARGYAYPVVARVSRVAPATKASDAKKIGIPAAAGAAIGAIVGGGKGALVGTAIGGGAGTAVVLSTPGKPVTLERGRVMTVSLTRSVSVRAPVSASE